MYSRLQCIKKSISVYLTDQIELNTCYTIGDGASYLQFFDAFPTNEDFSLPSISLDLETDLQPVPHDLGAYMVYPCNFVIDVFGRRNFERDYLTGEIKESLEDKRFNYWDYNAACVVIDGKITITRATSDTMHIEEPSEGEYRGRVMFTANLYQKSK